jgi:hypothetical protein
MAEVDFDEWLKNYKPVEVKYYAAFNNVTGEVTGIYPSTAIGSTENYVTIDNDTAHLINEGKIRLSSCFVDVASGVFEIAEIKKLTKIDDVLHRIVDKEYAGLLVADVTVIQSGNTLRFELAEKYKTRKIHWDGNTEMSFLVTEYNDPNVVRHTIKFTVDALVTESQVSEKLNLNKKFSVYTKRLFPIYVFEKK